MAAFSISPQCAKSPGSFAIGKGMKNRRQGGLNKRCQALLVEAEEMESKLNANKKQRLLTMGDAEEP
jgi:hypothetical protein